MEQRATRYIFKFYIQESIDIYLAPDVSLINGALKVLFSFPDYADGIAPRK